MFKKNALILSLIIMLFLSACNSKAKEQKQADDRLAIIETLIANNQYEQAKTQIDSIHLLFRKLVDKRKIAAALMDTIVRRESAKTLLYSDSILPLKLKEFDSIQANFRFEKNDKYQEFGNYVYKTQITEQNASRNYLKFYANENADLFLVSNFTGTKIEHKVLKISTINEFIQSDTTLNSKAVFYNFSDEGLYFESLTLKNEDAQVIAQFIEQHKTEKITVNLLGKRKATYILADSDKKAIVETLKFWMLKKDIKTLENNIRIATIRIGKIKLLYAN